MLVWCLQTNEPHHSGFLFPIFYSDIQSVFKRRNHQKKTHKSYVAIQGKVIPAHKDLGKNQVRCNLCYDKITVAMQGGLSKERATEEVSKKVPSNGSHI